MAGRGGADGYACADREVIRSVKGDGRQPIKCRGRHGELRQQCIRDGEVEPIELCSNLM